MWENKCLTFKYKMSGNSELIMDFWVKQTIKSKCLGDIWIKERTENCKQLLISVFCVNSRQVGENLLQGEIKLLLIFRILIVEALSSKIASVLEISYNKCSAVYDASIHI
jgi:hypothetical protein